ncbi:White collar 1 protein [Pleurostoma richardsiae]|uniref:White collar 1 protein n=1 Tax=Pleurostoma richardsiae TaxID=41990 RepID=A0AA38R0E7_9PEZI|nr:White collar 1 protein [Pleurostoma richardsiae]
MNNFYGNQLPPDELQLAAEHQRRQARQRPSVAIPTTVGQAIQPGVPLSSGMETPAMMGGESLDDIIRDNSHELHRRRSVPHPFTGHLGQDEHDRRVSMIEFGSAGQMFRDFQFGGIAGASPVAAMPAYDTMGGTTGIPGTSAAFPQPMLAISHSNDFPAISSDLMSSMTAFSNLNMGQLPAGDASAMDLFALPDMPDHLGIGTIDPVPTGFEMDMNAENTSLSASTTDRPADLRMDDADEEMSVPHSFSNSAGGLGDGLSARRQRQQTAGADRGVASFQPSIPSVPRELPSGTSFHSPVSSASHVSTARPSIAPETPTSVPPPSTSAPTPLDIKPEKNVYSKSGFDMVRALYYVATRQNPEVNLGAVDMSCAFVVCDVTQNDCPIIYVSDNFQNLTGYSRHEIVGQNCRFLQAPDGKVEAGAKREFVENDAVYNLKRKIEEGKEVQQSLINYRKGGKPFLNLLTMIPIPWDTKDIRYFIGFQIDLVECPDAISGQAMGGVQVNYTHSDIGQYIWTPPSGSQWEPENGQTLGMDDVSTLLQRFNPKGTVSDWHKQTWDKMLLENTDDVVHVLSLKGLFLHLSPSCKRVLEYDTNDLVGTSLSSVCHPSDIVPVTRELKDTAAGTVVSIVFRIRRKISGFTWFESRGSLFVEHGKGRKCIILVGRKRPVFALSRRDLEANGGIGDSELWTKLSTSGMFLFVSSNVRSLLDLQPENLEGTSIQDLMLKESRGEFGRAIEKARRGKIVTCKHEVQNRKGQVLQAQTVLYPGDAAEGHKPTFLLAQTKLLKASSRAAGAAGSRSGASTTGPGDDSLHPPAGAHAPAHGPGAGQVPQPLGGALTLGTQDAALAADVNIFDELKTTRCTSWQYELRQMEKMNRILAEELGQLLSNKKKRKRRKGVGNVVRDCANCHTKNTPEWRRGPSGQRDLCNSCGLRWAKQIGRVSSRASSRGNGDSQSKKSNSPAHSSPLQRELIDGEPSAFGEMRPSRSSSATSAGSNNASTAVPPGASSKSHHTMPPPSQPLLDGGSGFRGTAMEMTFTRETRED